jgi:hypothetical protein
MRANLTGLAQLLAGHAETVHIGPAELVIFDVDAHVSDETVGASRTRFVLVLDPGRVIPSDMGPPPHVLRNLIDAWRRSAADRRSTVEGVAVTACADDLAVLLGDDPPPPPSPPIAESNPTAVKRRRGRHAKG